MPYRGLKEVTLMAGRDNNVIVITRQFGSLGRPIAKKVAKELGLKYIDREIIENAASRMGYPIEELEMIDNHRIRGFERMRYPLGLGSRETQDKLYELEKSLILEYAAYENCVIVGRCANYILKDKPNVLKLHIFAPKQDRVKNSVVELGMTTNEAGPMVDKIDEARSAFYTYHTHEMFNSIEYHDLMINSSLMPIDDTVRLICDTAKIKFGLK